MDETTNMKLKKPVENEYISIEIINENMDIIDTGMKEISDSVDAPVFDDSGSVVGITNKTTLLASFVSKMPLVKFLRNVKAGFKLVSFVGDIVNNCVTDNANLPLSAAQGKKLMDLYTVLNTKNDNYGKILWTGSSFFTTPEDVPDCSNYRVLIFHNSIGAHSVWRDSILTFTYLANSALYIDTFSVIRNGNTIRLTNNTRYCAGTISTSDIPITKIIGII